MELIERRARDLPVMFLVHIAQRHRIGDKLVEIIDACPADVLRQRDRQLRNGAERLGLALVVIPQWPYAVENILLPGGRFLHGTAPSKIASAMINPGTFLQLQAVGRAPRSPSALFPEARGVGARDPSTDRAQLGGPPAAC